MTAYALLALGLAATLVGTFLIAPPVCLAAGGVMLILAGLFGVEAGD